MKYLVAINVCRNGIPRPQKGGPPIPTIESESTIPETLCSGKITAKGLITEMPYIEQDTGESIVLNAAENITKS